MCVCVGGGGIYNLQNVIFVYIKLVYVDILMTLFKSAMHNFSYVIKTFIYISDLFVSELGHLNTSPIFNLLYNDLYPGYSLLS